MVLRSGHTDLLGESCLSFHKSVNTEMLVKGLCFAKSEASVVLGDDLERIPENLSNP